MHYRILLYIGGWLLAQTAIAQDTVRMAKPVFTTEAPARIAAGATYTYRFNAMDSAGRAVTYSTGTLPAWLHYNSSTHSITGKAGKPGQYAVSLSASNGIQTITQHVMLTVYDAQTVNILCLGNSITNGTNKYNSYRRDLWQMLHNGHYNFDLIGSWNKHHMGGDVPDPDFDMDHDGHSGWTAAHVFTPPDWDSARGNIHTWLRNYRPDMVLVELGTNDVFQCRKPEEVIKDLGELAKTFRAKNPSVKLFIAQIPPLGAQWADKKLCGNDQMYKEAIHILNEQIAAFVSGAGTSNSPVILVDQFTGVDPATDMYDDIHPNDKGERIMAERWFEAIRSHLKKLP